ncbi:MAG: zinc-dependent metalloprotease family protein, partial [Ferruginibacter sp.]
MKKIYQIIAVVLFPFSLIAQNSFFSPVSESSIFLGNNKREIVPTKYNTVKTDINQLKTFLWSLPAEKQVTNRKAAPVMELPMPDGTIARFNVWESNVMEPGLAAQLPDMRQFLGQGIDDPYATIRFDYNPFTGFHAQILSSQTGRIYIDPFAKGDLNHYISYSVKDYNRDVKFICEVVDNEIASKGSSSQVTAAACLGANLRTYRLALACTGEYSVAVAGPTPTVGAVAAAMLTSVNRVTGVYEVEVSLRMTLIANNNLLIYLNGATDPYTNNNGSAMLGENQANIDAVIGSANYDIGHVFSTGGGGIASLNSPCNSGSKARGVTGSSNPVGDAFDIDYVAHEMGHQWGGNHSMAGCGSSPASTKYEVGSGTTIQGYAGICGGENIQPNSDPHFHGISFDEISNYITTGNGNTCGVSTATGNDLPVISALPNNNLSIPPSTPFTLAGTATDPNNDPLTYCWEGWDTQGTQTWNAGATAPAGNTVPLFKSRIPKTNGTRTFPDIAVILAGYPASPPSAMGGLKGETLSPVARAMNFRLTVRDNRAGGGGVVSSGGAGCQTSTPFVVNVVGTTPFVVSVPNGGESYTGGSTQTVTWNVANTNNAPVSVANVMISLSTDGGLTYPTVLLASTPNDGSQAVTMPNITSTTARVKVEAVGNIFFDISNANFSITGGTATNPTVTINQAAAQPDPTSASPINFTVVFDQAVTGFATGDVTLSGTAGATTGTVTGSGTTYNVAVTGMTMSGTVIATIPAGVCVNTLNETNLASTSTDNTVTFNLGAAICTTFVGSVGPANTATSLRAFRDAVASTCAVPGPCTAGLAGALHYVQHTWTNPVNAVQCVTVTYSNPTTNLSFVTAHDGSVVLTNLCTNYLGDPGSSAPAGGAPIVWSFNAPALATIVFHVGNVTAGQTADYNIQISAPICAAVTAPTVTINQGVTQPDPTSASPINFDVVFSEPVTGFATGDVTLSGTAGATTATVTGSGATYNVAVTGMTANGTVIATIAANVATGTINPIGNAASTSTDNTVTFSTVCIPPTVTPVPNQSLCAGSPTAPVNFTGTPGAIFDWTNTNPAIGLAASGTGNIPSFIATNNTAAPIVGTITVTPSLPGGGSGPCTPSVAQTFTNNTPVAIPTGPGVVTSTITVSGAPTFLYDLNMLTNITHTFNSDLDITIMSPSGTVVTLTSDNGAGNDNVFNGTLWDDNANPGGQVPYTTNNGLVTDQAYVNLTTATPLVPEEALAAFIGEDPNGVWTITISDDLAGDGGSLDSWALIITGLPAAPTLTTSSFTNNTPVVIPTGPGVVTSTINVTGVGTQLFDVNMTTFIRHTFNSDLDITITSPAGTVVTLTSDNGAGNDNVFNGTIWDDSANPGGQVPYTSNNGLVTDHTYANLTLASPLVPEEALGAFVGEDPNGVWTLTISDDLAGDGGTLDSWTLDLQTAICGASTCVGTPTSFTITVNPNSSLVILADPGTTLCEGDPTLLTVYD